MIWKRGASLLYISQKTSNSLVVWGNGMVAGRKTASPRYNKEFKYVIKVSRPGFPDYFLATDPLDSLVKYQFLFIVIFFNI